MTTANTTVFSIDELLDANDIKYVEVNAYGGMVRIGSLSSADMLDWVDDNEDPKKRKRAGLRLLVRSIVDADGKRIHPERVEAFIEAFGQKDATDNGKVIQAVLELNGLSKAAKIIESAKNE